MSRFESYGDAIKVFGMTNQLAETELSRDALLERLA